MNKTDKLIMVIQLAEEMSDKLESREKTKKYNASLEGEKRWKEWRSPEPKAGIIANGLKIRKLLIEIEKELE